MQKEIIEYEQTAFDTVSETVSGWWSAANEQVSGPENTKIVFTGDINQIDTPYLDAESNGLSYVIDRVKNHSLFAHVNLEKGERSELANLANELL